MKAEEIEMLRNLNNYAVVACGKIFSKKLCYAVKDVLLNRYAKFNGYDLQFWYEYGWDAYCIRCGNTANNKSCMPNSCIFEPLSEHYHILKRFDLNGAVFHRPTNEFYYYNCEVGGGRESPNYDEFRKICKNKIEGKKERDNSKEVKEKGVKALKYFIRNYRLCPKNQKP